MWKRKALKRNAKDALKINYWRCVLAALLLTIAIGTGAGARSAVSSTVNNSTNSITDDTVVNKYYENQYEYETYGSRTAEGSMEKSFSVLENTMPPIVLKLLSSITLFVVLIFTAISAVVNIFILRPLEVGGCNFFKTNTKYAAELSTILLPFEKKYYWKMVGIMFLRNLYIVLWTCLLIIPGIIKIYEYRMIPYILADKPQINRKDVFLISKKMMKGNKWKAFIFDLSFIGWQLVSLMTCGIAGILYVNPYMYAAKAELYIVLKYNYVKNIVNRG